MILLRRVCQFCFKATLYCLDFWCDPNKTRHNSAHSRGKIRHWQKHQSTSNSNRQTPRTIRAQQTKLTNPPKNRKSVFWILTCFNLRFSQHFFCWTCFLGHLSLFRLVFALLRKALPLRRLRAVPCRPLERSHRRALRVVRAGAREHSGGSHGGECLPGDGWRGIWRSGSKRGPQVGCWGRFFLFTKRFFWVPGIFDP